MYIYRGSKNETSRKESIQEMCDTLKNRARSRIEGALCKETQKELQ